MVQKGWEALGKDSDDEDETEDAGTDGFDLSLLKFNDSGLCESADVDKEKTTPPRYFTESTLLAAMTSAAKFIDDPALRRRWKRKTRAAVIVAVSERKPPARVFLRNWRQIPGLSPSKRKGVFGAGMENHKTRRGVLRCTAS
ncbi:hypothetical protein IUJ34_27535 (plasmid) [Klebsiella pneumoniae subsp. pneumoniae]|uniref:Uncharacterized protein n=1 Tax=Klebsiella pneumoniae subsp. pneumoniae TaxID=72407 RepID=A0A7S9E1Y7_KLEPN|nr:hypothetical protein IUJ34_27535 [Klebsiella pneumoniae subsp. pneumoniae]